MTTDPRLDSNDPPNKSTATMAPKKPSDPELEPRYRPGPLNTLAWLLLACVAAVAIWRYFQ